MTSMLFSAKIFSIENSVPYMEQSFNDNNECRDPAMSDLDPRLAAALAIEAGVDNRTLTHLAIEEDQIDALLLERKLFIERGPDQ